MAFKFVSIFCLIALASAGDYEYNKPSTNNQASASYDTKPSDNNHDNIKQLVAPTPVQHDNQDQHSYSETQQNDNSYQQEANSNDDRSYDENISSSSYDSSNDNSYNPTASQTYQAAPSSSYHNDQYGYNYNPVAYYPPAKYDYSYSVNDPTTGDIKSHSESRDGYYVRGAYSLVDPDGYKRTVTYTADNVNGFNAVVNREPYVVQHPVPVGKYQSSGTVQNAEKSNDSHHNLADSAQDKDSYSSPPAQDGKGPYA